jgi:hypothetical protein
MKFAADTAIDVLATGIRAAVVDIFATGIGLANGATSVSRNRQNQRASYHCT